MAKTTNSSRRSAQGKRPVVGAQAPEAADKPAPEPSPNENRPTRYDVDAAEFCRVWETSETLDEVVEQLNMPRGVVAARASGYRELGIKLKKMQRGRKSSRALDVAALNEMLAGLKKGSDKIRAAKKAEKPVPQPKPEEKAEALPPPAPAPAPAPAPRPQLSKDDEIAAALAQVVNQLHAKK